MSLFQERQICPLTSSYPQRLILIERLVSNRGRAIVKTLAVKFEENEILSVDDFEEFAFYRGLWKTVFEKQNIVRQGIIYSGGCTLNCKKLRINAGDKDATNAQDDAIAKPLGTSLLSLLTLKC